MVLQKAVVMALRFVLGADLDRVGDLSRFLADPPNPDMGDLAFGCFALGKLLHREPDQTAIDIAEQIEVGGLIARVEPNGPYVNFFADPAELLAATCQAVETGALRRGFRKYKAPKVMIEYSQPNTHKTFHVGHLRNVALGDALVRIHRARGHEVVAANYYGDFGIDVAKCLWWLDTRVHEDPPEVGRSAWLGAAYTAANEALDPKLVAPEVRAQNLAEVRAVLAQMEARAEPVWSRYLETRQWCLDEFKAGYTWLGATFDVDFFESEVEEEASRIVDDCLARGVFERSEGAVICDLTPDVKVPALVRKSDGSSLYMTWDLALAKRKFEDHGVEQSLYVVGSEQRLHFKQLFATLSRMGYERAADCRHVSYELVALPEGKMSSRKGTATPMHELQAAVCAAVERHLEGAGARVPEAHHDETVRRIAVACLRYGMLKAGTNKQVVFQLDDWTNLQGDTGAYLLYGLARIRSIFRKGDVTVDLTADVRTDAFGAPEERELLNLLAKYPAAVKRAAETCDPSGLATFCYDCVRAFSRFYLACPVLKAEGELRTARLALCAVADRVLTEALGLLGIEAVDAM